MPFNILKKMKRAQIRMGESIAVMFIFFLLIIAGFIFYSKIEKRNIGLEKDESADLRAIETAQVVSFLPEIQCIQENVQVYNCFDILKIIGMKGVTENNKLYYYDLLQYSNITIEQVYPNSVSSWNIYSNVREDWKKKISTQIPVALFNATGNGLDIKPYYAFGVMYVDVFI